MWCQSGFDPDSFWHQTPLHFQLAMRGVRKRLTAAAEASLREAWWGGAFAGLTQSKGGLKPLNHYLRKNSERRMAPDAMLAAFQSMEARGAPMSIRKFTRAELEARNANG